MKQKLKKQNKSQIANYSLSRYRDDNVSKYDFNQYLFYKSFKVDVGKYLVSHIYNHISFVRKVSLGVPFCSMGLQPIHYELNDMNLVHVFSE